MLIHRVHILGFSLSLGDFRNIVIAGADSIAIITQPSGLMEGMR